MEIVDQIIRAMRTADEDEMATLKERLLQLALGADGPAVCTHIEHAMRGEVLEIRWELEEILEAAQPAPAPAAAVPPPPPEPEPEPEPEPDPRQLRASDLNIVYQDPQGVTVHRTKKGDRWFVSQPDPYTGKFQTFEVPSHQVPALKEELSGSPYWRLGEGA